MSSTIERTAPANDLQIDRTSLFDIAKLWPDPLKCPDWPYLKPGWGYDGPRGRRGAELRLETVGLYLNKGSRRLRLPTDAEREYQTARLFRTDQPGQWTSLGFGNLSPIGRMAEGEAELAVEAAHLRGYLRKLDALDEKAIADQKRNEELDARHKLANYRAKAPEILAEIEGMAEAVARHKQREADELAVRDTHARRQTLNEMYYQAVSAAHKLGLSVPDAPAYLDEA